MYIERSNNNNNLCHRCNYLINSINTWAFVRVGMPVVVKLFEVEGPLRQLVVGKTSTIVLRASYSQLLLQRKIEERSHHFVESLYRIFRDAVIRNVEESGRPRRVHLRRFGVR